MMMNDANFEIMRLKSIVTQFTESGLITSKRIYFDQATVMRQIALLPSDVAKLPLSAAFPVHVGSRII
jgi:hypothetical protein